MQTIKFTINRAIILEEPDDNISAKPFTKINTLDYDNQDILSIKPFAEINTLDYDSQDILSVKPFAEINTLDYEEMSEFLSSITPPPAYEPDFQNDIRDEYGTSFILCTCGYRKNCKNYRECGYDCENLRVNGNTFLRAPWCKNYRQYSFGTCFCQNDCKCVKTKFRRCC